MSDFERDHPDEDAIRQRAYEISQGPDAATPEDDWSQAERELGWAESADGVEPQTAEPVQA